MGNGYNRLFEDWWHRVPVPVLNAPPNPRNPSRPRCQAGAVEHTAYVKAELQTKFDFISDLLEMLLVVCPTTVPSPPHPMDRTTVNLPFKSA